MSDFNTQYNNPILVTGLKIIEPVPVDDRLIVATEDSLRNLFTPPLSTENLDFIATLYDGLVILASDSKKEFIWCESNYGLLETSYVYPPYTTNIAGQNYANKSYNFVLFDKVAKISAIYDNAADDGIFISSDFLPYRVINEPSSAVVTIKSSDTGYTELEYPDRIEFVAAGITIILDPKPSIGEQFRITIQ